MYTKAGSLAATGSIGGLAYTGVSTTAIIITGFALLAAGFALWRLAPRIRRSQR